MPEGIPLDELAFRVLVAAQLLSRHGGGKPWQIDDA
jgi:hypothetical protein